MVKKYLRNIDDGMYHVNGQKYKMLTGSRAQVHHDTAYKTRAGLTKSDIKKNSHGKIVSVKKSMQAKRDNRLWKLGFRTEKGKFGMVRVDAAAAKKTRRKTRRKRR
jgi:hypothetical protein